MLKFFGPFCRNALLYTTTREFFLWILLFCGVSTVNATAITPGWSLVGNPSYATLDVAALLGDPNKVNSVWKWVPGAGGTTGNWAFYTPALPDGGQSYAMSKNFRTLLRIDPGDGFWINAKTAFNLVLPAATPINSQDFSAAGKLPVASGWNLLSVGDNVDPRAFNNVLGAPAPAMKAGLNLRSLWAWNKGDALTGKLPGWFFYAPLPDNDGSLVSVIENKGYFDFFSQGKLLDGATGFWVNAINGNGLPVSDRGSGQIVLPNSSLVDGLVSFWHLDGDWRDAMGRHDLTPATAGGFSSDGYPHGGANQVYGPTGSDTGNGATNAEFTVLPEDAGVTLSGWTFLPDNGTGGGLFGWKGAAWGDPNFFVGIAWGFIWVYFGATNDGAVIQYPRIGDTCWHNLTLVLPAGFRTGKPFKFYLDGVETAPVNISSSATGGAFLGAGTSLWGSPFEVGQFVDPAGVGSSGSSSARNMKLDEIGVWKRALNDAEIATISAPQGSGKACLNAPPPNWAPGPRSVPPATPPVPQLDLGVHILTNDSIAVITDPNPWLKQRITADSGTYLTAMEKVRSQIPAWFPAQSYDLAAREAITRYRPPILAALSTPAHFTVARDGVTLQAVASYSLWPQSTREFLAPGFDAGGTQQHTTSSEVVYYSYLKLSQPMQSGAIYVVTDEWGGKYSFIYDEVKSLSWAIKVNQIGYQSDSHEKIAYFGSWQGAAGGALDLTRFEVTPQSFNLRREADNTVVYSGSIVFRADESQYFTVPPWNTDTIALSGERVYQADFSAFNTPGRYYVQAAGIGRSWSFEIGPNALGEAFYTYTRGLYHQRCSALDPARTPWARGDIHHPTYQALHPTELGAYADNTAQGWGFTDETGAFPSGMDAFTVISATATSEVALADSGEWHDAGDFSRDGMGHVRTVEYLSLAYLLFPQNFSDNQLNIPESGNGLPDILDEAVWGMDYWRRLQEPDGRVGLYVEASSHPQIGDPGQDTQPYYRGLATRNSSLQYAENAARLVRALNLASTTLKSSNPAGAQLARNLATVFLDSAQRAYRFGMTDYQTLPRISISFPYNGHTISWIEPATQDSGAQVKALVQLWLASGDTAYYDAMNTAAMTTIFKSNVDSLYWRDSSVDYVDVALAPASFPSGWSDYVRAGIVMTADNWLGWQATNAYRNLWYTPGQGYFTLMGWGNNEFDPAMHLLAAWVVTGDDRYRAGMTHMTNWMIGANPQGRSLTTGLGSNHVVAPLHLPSMVDRIDEAVPGITIYGYTFGIPLGARQVVYGLYDTPIPGMAYDGVNLAQLPPPWNNTALSMTDVSNILYSKFVLWRNLVTLEGANVPQTEFTVTSPMGAAVLISGALMGAGWQPSAALINRQPKSAAQLRDMLWYQP